ncbi:MAG: endonuclease/exonuclease/phosphatase family protein, partial [Bacteroidota bacterium]|nr:endonuclease/exonuclease/phosphatase family protein [Bacteroidota bacterium]
IGIIILYLLTCLCPFVNTSQEWYLAFPGLIFPLIFFGLVFFIIVWMVVKSKWWIVSAIVLLLGFQQIITAFAFNIPKEFSAVKKPNTLRVIQWNVEGFHQYDDEQVGQIDFAKMMNLIKNQNADVLCFEEYFDLINERHFRPNATTITSLGYPYHYFVSSDFGKNDFETGIAIFSKYPIVDTANYSFKEERTGEHLLYADIKVNEKTFRVFATHLQSVHFEGKDYANLRRIASARKPSFRDSRDIVSKLKRGYVSRYKQASLVSEKIKESPYTSFICGDFNDVPNSSTYFKIKGNFQDAFLQKGFFIGRTFRFISPTLRIDYILADKKFKVTQFQRIKVPYSDHYPVEADLAY